MAEGEVPAFEGPEGSFSFEAAVARDERDRGADVEQMRQGHEAAVDAQDASAILLLAVRLRPQHVQ